MKRRHVIALCAALTLGAGPAAFAADLDGALTVRWTDHHGHFAVTFGAPPVVRVHRPPGHGYYYWHGYHGPYYYGYYCVPRWHKHGHRHHRHRHHHRRHHRR